MKKSDQAISYTEIIFTTLELQTDAGPVFSNSTQPDSLGLRSRTAQVYVWENSHVGFFGTLLQRNYIFFTNLSEQKIPQFFSDGGWELPKR